MAGELNKYTQWRRSTQKSTEGSGFIMNRLTCPGQCQGLYEDRQGRGHHHHWVKRSEVNEIMGWTRGLTTARRKELKADSFHCLNVYQKHTWTTFCHVTVSFPTSSLSEDVYVAQTYLWHLLGNNVNHVSWCDVFFALRTRVVFLPSAALLFPLFLFFLFLLGSLFLPPLLL